MRIAYVDTETTGTNPNNHEVWEIGLVLADEEAMTVESHEWQVPFVNIDFADAKALEIGGFQERYAPTHTSRLTVASEFAWRTQEARLASCNISFDTAFLRAFLHGEHVRPAWHYSPIDVKSLCYGCEPVLFGAKTDELLEAFGLEKGAERHTALHDAQLAKALADRVRFGVRG